MNFEIPKREIRLNIIDLMRKLGYKSLGRSRKENELSFVRPLRGDYYPRFHIIIKLDIGSNFLFNIHLDQKRSSYKGSLAHSAEYDGPIIDTEKERIEKIIKDIGDD